MLITLLCVGILGLSGANAFNDPMPPLEGPENRIVGGTNAEIGEFPWQLSLEMKQLVFFWSHICGATLINKNTAITAAHCVDKQSPSNFRVIAGSTNRGSSNNKQTIYVTDIISHPQWDTSGDGYPNDIAILKLTTDAAFNDYVEPAPLAPEGKLFDGETCIITGWGNTVGGSPSIPNWLQKVSMTVLTNADCGSRWSSIAGAEVNDGHICIFEEPKSACNGDSGGPMVCVVNGEQHLVGVTSWGVSNCGGHYPSVYTRVTSFLEWINSVA